VSERVNGLASVSRQVAHDFKDTEETGHYSVPNISNHQNSMLAY
jgi:hypothetical protein